MNFSFTDQRRLWLFRILCSTMLAFVGLEAISLVCWLSSPFLPMRGGSWVSAFLDGEAWLFYSSSTLAPAFAMLLLFSWVTLIFKASLGSVIERTHFTVKFGRKELDVDRFLRVLRSTFDSMFETSNEKSKYGNVILALSVVLAFSVAVYPYLPSLNPAGRFVGVDIPTYVKWLMEIDKQGNLWNASSYAFTNFADRPLSLILIYSEWKILGVSAWQAVQFLPILLGPSLVLATFFFMRKSGFNSWIASLAALFAVFSFHVSVGMYGGFLSNWIGLVFLYLALGFLFWSLLKKRWLLLGVAIALQAILLLVHAYTWWMFMGILAVFFLLTFAKWLKARRKESGTVKIASVALVANISAGIARSLVFGFGSTSAELSEISQAHLSWIYLQSFWQTLTQTLGREMGSSFMNPLLFFLALFGGIAVALDDRLISRFLTSCVAATSLFFVFGDARSVQSRILYNLPIHIFALVGFVLLARSARRLFSSRESKKLVLLLSVWVLLININYAFRGAFDLTQTGFHAF